MATKEPNITGDLPPDPNVGMMLALLYRRLGGSFSIASNGSRYFGRPEPCYFRLQGQDLPQLAGAKPHERFLCPEEWAGAIKLVEALLQRLHSADSDMIFDLLATVALDERKCRPSIEDPRRPSTC